VLTSDDDFRRMSKSQLIDMALAAGQGGFGGAERMRHPDMTLTALQTWLAGEHEVRLSNGAMWSAVDRLGLSFKKRRSAPPSRTVRMSPPGAASGGQRSPSSMLTSSFSLTRPAPAPR
jgi:hypothetical protein